MKLNPPKKRILTRIETYHITIYYNVKALVIKIKGHRNIENSNIKNSKENSP